MMPSLAACRHCRIQRRYRAVDLLDVGRERDKMDPHVVVGGRAKGVGMRVLHGIGSPLKRLDSLRLIGVVLPPLAVKMCGEGDTVFLNIALTLLFWVPGVVHAQWVISHYHQRHAAYQPDQIIAAMRNHIRR